jgi:hypothetical protein
MNMVKHHDSPGQCDFTSSILAKGIKMFRGKFELYSLFVAMFLGVGALFSQDYPLLYEETFEGGCSNWSPNIPENWSMGADEHGAYFALLQAGPVGSPRRPTSMAILKPYVVGDFELEVVAKCNTDSTNIWRDLCLFYGYQDSVHFYYTHFSARSDDNHNITAIVNNADRLKINTEASGTTKTRLTDCQYHTFKIKRSISSGSIEAYFDNEKIITAVDSTFLWGRVGIGSFDDVATFSSVTLWGERAETTVRSTASPADFTLFQNYPNPFNPKTTIRFSVSRPQNVTLTIYDMLGRERKRLVDEAVAAGSHDLVWDGTDDAGLLVTNGVYVYQLKTDYARDIKKMILLK